LRWPGIQAAYFLWGETLAMSRIHSTLLTAAGMLLALTMVAAAQTYPTKPIRLIITFAPGGLNDTAGRVVANALGERLGKKIVVENRTGAGGVVGTELGAQAPKDGYTLLLVSMANTVNPWMYKLSYDPIKAFAPVAYLASAPNVLSVNKELPVASVKELIALARQQPGKLQYATGGVGSFMHLGGELFKMMGGIDMLAVPFRGGGPALTDVIGGHTKLAFATVVATGGHVRSGRLRALGVGGKLRHPLLPDVPTIAEAALPGYEVANWIGIVAPAGTPQPIVDRLHKEIGAALETAEVQKRLSAEGAQTARMSSAEFGEFMVSQLEKWGGVIKKAGIKRQ
jgi:tripartite-type tricarboxylate transporter receptor subunit TctC